MDLSQYKRLKEKKAVSLIKIRNKFCLAADRYDPETGVLVDDAIIEVKLDQVEQMIAELEARVTAMKELLSDMLEMKKSE